MARKAFLLGCNSAGLKHCQTDAALMKKALEPHGYDITMLEAEHQAPYWELLKHLQEFLNACTPADTMIFYFAGHSLNEGRSFKFILAQDINNVNNQLLAESLLPILKQCQAADKVIILDCCRSGKTADDYDWQGAAGEWCRIFTATSSKETALETDEGTCGGLFTTWIYQALTVAAARLADEDGFLRINRLDDHVQQQANNYRSPKRRPAPVPRLYGSTDKKIVLTAKITSLSNPNTGYPPYLITELKTVLACHRPAAEQIKQCFEACRAGSNPVIPYPAAYTAGNLNGLFDYCADLYYQAGNSLPLPLVSFVARLSDSLGNPAELKGCLDRLTDWLGQQAAVIPEQLAAARGDSGPVAPEQTPYLMIEIDPRPGGGSYYVYCYWQDSRGEQQPLRVDEEEVSLRAVPTILGNVLNALTGPRPWLELFLPKVLLTDNDTLRHWEQWAFDSPPAAPDERARGLGVEYPVSLRCRERLREVERYKQCGADHLKRYWPKYHACLHKPLARGCADWLKPKNKEDYIDRLHSDDPFIGLHFPPPPAYLSELLNAGAAIAVWPRQDNLSAAMQELLGRYFKEPPLAELPETLREVRENLFVKSKGAPTGELSLLWDDPNRQPEQADVPLETVRLEFAV